MLASLVMCWNLLKKLLKIVAKLRYVLAVPEGAVTKVLASLEKCCQLLKELVKIVDKLKKVLAFPERAVKNPSGNANTFLCLPTLF